MPSADPLAVAVLLVVYLPQALVLAAVDGRELRLPNRNIALLSGTALLALGVVALVSPALAAALRPALATALVLGLIAVLVALVAPPVLGMGDAKTVPVVSLVAAALGIDVLIAGLLGVAVLGGLQGAAVLALRRGADTAFPFGPTLLAAPFVGLAGAPLVRGALGF